MRVVCVTILHQNMYREFFSILESMHVCRSWYNTFWRNTVPGTLLSWVTLWWPEKPCFFLSPRLIVLFCVTVKMCVCDISLSGRYHMWCKKKYPCRFDSSPLSTRHAQFIMPRCCFLLFSRICRLLQHEWNTVEEDIMVFLCVFSSVLVTFILLYLVPFPFPFKTHFDRVSRITYLLFPFDFKCSLHECGLLNKIVHNKNPGSFTAKARSYGFTYLNHWLYN